MFNRHPIAQIAIDFIAAAFGIFFVMTLAVSGPASLYVLLKSIDYASRANG